jgi:hypothetical protein
MLVSAIITGRKPYHGKNPIGIAHRNSILDMHINAVNFLMVVYKSMVQTSWHKAFTPNLVQKVIGTKY